MASVGSLVDDQRLKSTDMDLEAPRTSEVVTFEPFTTGFTPPRPLPQRNGRKVNSKNKCETEILPGIFEPLESYEKYLTFKLAEDKRAQELDMFEANRDIIKVCGREPNIMVQGDGTILVEATSPEESKKLQALSFLNGNVTKCYPHKKLNQCRGVIRSTALLRYSEDRLQKEFEDQKVTEVRQMKKKIDGNLVPLPVYVLTFNLLQLPPKIKAAWLRLDVRPFVPSPRRCFYCQKFGHVSNSCRRKIKGEASICNNCGQVEHGECHSPSLCANCKENHPASSKKCDRFIMEREIQALRARERISFVDAKQRVSNQFIRPGVTYASIAEKSRKINNITNKVTQIARIVNVPNLTSNELSTKRNATVNKRRRVSGEEELLPSKIPLMHNSGTNRFELLDDEATASLPSGSADLENVSSGPKDKGSHSTSSTVLVQAEVHVSASPVDRAEPPSPPLTAEERDLSISGQTPTSVEGENIGLADPMEDDDTSTPALPLRENKGGVNSKGNAQRKSEKTATEPNDKLKGSTPSRNRQMKVPEKNEKGTKSNSDLKEPQSNSRIPQIRRFSKSKK